MAIRGAAPRFAIETVGGRSQDRDKSASGSRGVRGNGDVGKEKAFGEVEAIEWAKLSLDCAILRCI